MGIGFGDESIVVAAAADARSYSREAHETAGRIAASSTSGVPTSKQLGAVVDELAVAAAIECQEPSSPPAAPTAS